MKERAENETLYKYWFRRYLEEPGKVVGFGALCALGFVYYEGQQKADEYRADMKEMNTALIARLEADTQALHALALKMEAANSRLDVMSNRMEHLEREHEMNRKDSGK